MILAGLPATIEYGGTSCTTVALAAIIDPLPIFTPDKIFIPQKIQTLLPISIFPIAAG